MALQEKVAIAILTLIVFQITSKRCMPRSLKTPWKSIKTRKYSPRLVPKYSTFKEQPKETVAPVTSVCKAFQFPETEYSKAPTNYLNTCFTKSKKIETLNNNSKAMSNCPKKSKIMDSIKRDKNKQNNNSTKKFVEPMKSVSVPIYFNGRFPEVEYPLNIMETWSPRYWTQLPNTEMQKCRTPNNNKDTEIETNKKAIEKAVQALLRSQQTSLLLADTCPLNSQAGTQLLTLDRGSETLVTNLTTTPIVPQASDKRDSKKISTNKSASIHPSKKGLSLPIDRTIFVAPLKSLNPENNDLLHNSSVPKTTSLSLISATPNSGQSCISEVDSSPPITVLSVPIQETCDLPLKSVVRKTYGIPLSTATSPTIPTVPDNDSSIDIYRTVSNGGSSLGSILQTNDPHGSSMHPITDTVGKPSEGADATIPEITSTPPKSTMSDTNDFPAISQAEKPNTAFNNIPVPSTTAENAGKSSCLSDSSADGEPIIMKTQEDEYTTVSPFYNDLVVDDSLNYVPEKETWILDPDDKEYLIVW